MTLRANAQIKKPALVPAEYKSGSGVPPLFSRNEGAGRLFHDIAVR